MHEPEPKLHVADHIPRVLKILTIVCGILLLVDLFVPIHGRLPWEGWFGFSGVYGFISCILLVLAAKQLRKLIKRDEDYYDR